MRSTAPNDINRRLILGSCLFGLLAVGDTVVVTGLAQEAREPAIEAWGWRDPETVSMASAYYAVLGYMFTLELAFESRLDETTRPSSYLRSVTGLSQEASDALESYGRNSLNELMQSRFELSQMRCQNSDQLESKADYVEQLRVDAETFETLASEHFARALELLDEDDRDVFRDIVSGNRNWVRVTLEDRAVIVEASTEPVSAYMERDCSVQRPPVLL